MNRRENRQKLYNTTLWKKLSLYLRSLHPICERCGEAVSEHCHHLATPFEHGISNDEAYRRLLDPENIICVCPKCHQLIHEEQEKKKREWNKTEHLYIRY